MRNHIAICLDQHVYYVLQLSGSMHSETTAIYKLTAVEITNYKLGGIKAITSTLNYFSNLKNYGELEHDRIVTQTESDAIREAVYTSQSN